MSNLNFKKVIILLIGFLAVFLSIFLPYVFSHIESHYANLINLCIGIVIGTYTSSIIYYKTEFLNELEAIWNMLSTRVIPHKKYVIKQGSPVYNRLNEYQFDMQQDTSVKARYDLGPQWYFLNGWKRARMVEIYEITMGSKAPKIYRVRCYDLKKSNVTNQLHKY